MTDPVAIGPFTISVEQAVLSELRDRIRRTRWPHVVPGSGWEAGADAGYLRSLLDSWAGEFDWRAQERELNRLGHFRADVDGVRLHFIHERGNGPAPLPIVLTHGFPSSFVEYLDLLPLLTDPVDHGGRAEDAFDVVIVSPPGYGFSDPVAEPVLETRLGDLWCRLLCDGLGYTRFGAHGSDVGTGPTIQLGVRHPEHVVGIHLTAFYLSPPPEPWPPEVKEFIERQRSERAEHTAYSRMQSTRPQTAAFGLTDSPAGLAAWVIDLFRAFSDCCGDVESRFSRERLLTNLTLYWVSATIAPAMRAYYDFAHFEPPPEPDVRVTVPSGFAVFADSYRPGLARPPRALAEHCFNVTRWTSMPRGGHFAALEEPELLAEELRAFFRPLRGAQ
jgi:pimeloyl-ACP methyl ester carboxylesterase